MPLTVVSYSTARILSRRMVLFGISRFSRTFSAALNTSRYVECSMFAGSRLLDRQRAQGTTPLRWRHLPDKLEEQEGRCTICGGDIPQGKGANHIDHKTPRARGGSDDASNIQAVCARCNRRKGVKTLEELLAQETLPFQEPK